MAAHARRYTASTRLYRIVSCLARLGAFSCRQGLRVQVVRIVEAGEDGTLLIDTQFRQRRRGHGKLPVGLRRQPQGETEEHLQGPTMRHKSHGLVLTGSDNARVGCTDAL